MTTAKNVSIVAKCDITVRIDDNGKPELVFRLNPTDGPDGTYVIPLDRSRVIGANCDYELMLIDLASFIIRKATERYEMLTEEVNACTRVAQMAHEQMRHTLKLADVTKMDLAISKSKKGGD